MNTINTHDGLLGTIGVRFESETGYQPHKRYGWANPNENVEEVDPDFQANKKHSLAVVAYSDTAIMHPGTHMVCTTTIGAEGGVHGQNQQCKKILVCPHPTDY